MTRSSTRSIEVALLLTIGCGCGDPEPDRRTIAGPDVTVNATRSDRVAFEVCADDRLFSRLTLRGEVTEFAGAPDIERVAIQILDEALSDKPYFWASRVERSFSVTTEEVFAPGCETRVWEVALIDDSRPVSITMTTEIRLAVGAGQTILDFRIIPGAS